jgi:sulfatase maturation enzyme AslB (radical SAM superfamily)|tara:strand:- start:880 stop:1794 length:915 start_codon:yes stop_codon:yes gene_type:complete
MLMNLSINPTYYCNFACDFCYLTTSQLNDRHKITPLWLEHSLQQITDEIGHVDLYGGEIGLLTPEYYYSIKEMIRKHYGGSININTNLSAFPDFFRDEDVTLSVSYDFHAREKEQHVLNNMMNANKDLSVLILASPKVLEMDVEFMIFTLNMISNVKSVEIKPYSINQANQHNVTHKDFEDFVIKFDEAKTEKKFNFQNIDNIFRSIDKEYDAFSNDHVYITPRGKFGVLEFDKYDREYFKEYDTYYEYEKWAKEEPDKNLSDICKTCKYYGNCLTEHYRYVKDLTNSCNGYKGLLEYYERMES